MLVIWGRIKPVQLFSWHISGGNKILSAAGRGGKEGGLTDQRPPAGSWAAGWWTAPHWSGGWWASFCWAGRRWLKSQPPGEPRSVRCWGPSCSARSPARLRSRSRCPPGALGDRTKRLSWENVLLKATEKMSHLLPRGGEYHNHVQHASWIIKWINAFSTTEYWIWWRNEQIKFKLFASNKQTIYWY